jgi:ubiquinone biosynthesis protein COQ4
MLFPLLSAIAKGWKMGQAAKPLIEAWEKPVAVWQMELNVQPIS